MLIKVLLSAKYASCSQYINKFLSVVAPIKVLMQAAERERESCKGGRGREPKGRQREKLREAGFCGWLIGRVERIKFFAEQRGKKNVQSGMERRRREWRSVECRA